MIPASGIVSKPRVCNYCKSDLADHATFCKACNHYQNVWRNELKFWGGLTAVASLLVFVT